MVERGQLGVGWKVLSNLGFWDPNSEKGSTREDTAKWVTR
jgi:hypothetical protein